MAEPVIITHPLVQDKLSLLRDKRTESGMFRQLLAEISELIGYESMRDWDTHQQEIETMLDIKATANVVKSKEIVFVPILRAGVGMLQGMLRLVPSAHVGHIGLYRDPRSLSVIEYYFKMPAGMQNCHAIVLDPMIGTGHSAVVALTRVKETKAKSIIFITIVAAPEGIAHIQEHHPDITIYTAAIDKGLDSKGYIVPGLGDAGDRMFGTL